MKRVLPDIIDLSPLEFLEYGDRTLIAKEEQSQGRKTSPDYVSKVCKGYIRNDRILNRAFEIALPKMNKFPKQVLKAA